jgi:hypothetical protein
MPTSSYETVKSARELQTGWGTVQNLQVPMLECQHCKHDVICEYTIIEKYKRFWMDLAQEALWSSGCSQSLRDICERWSATVGHSVGLRTINERIKETLASGPAVSYQTLGAGPPSDPTGWHLGHHYRTRRSGGA